MHIEFLLESQKSALTLERSMSFSSDNSATPHADFFHILNKIAYVVQVRGLVIGKLRSRDIPADCSLERLKSLAATGR